MNINYTESFNFKPIPSITPASDYWQNGTWKFNMPEITASTSSQPSWQDIILSGNTALTLVNAKEDGLNYLKLFGGTKLLPETYLDTVTLSGGCEQRNLPSEYTQVEYIESDGTQYIDTGYEPNVNTEVKINFSTTTLPSSDAYMFHSSDSGSARISLAITQHLVFFGDDLNVSGNRIVLPEFTANTAYDITVNKDKTIVNSTEYTFTHTGVTLPTMGSIGLFGSRTGKLKCQGRVKSFSCNENNVLKINLIPCRRNSDNVLGMYDTVTGNFFTNAGTGTFTAGADVTAPSPTTPMDIICNNGVIKVNLNLYSTEYYDSTLSRVDGVTVTTNAGTRGVNVSSMIDCRTIKSFMVTAENTTGSYRLYKYNSSKSFINADATSNIGDVLTLDSTVGYFRIQYNYASINTQNILIYNSAYSLNGIYTDGTQEAVTDSLGNTASAERLLAVGNYKDTQEVLSGAVTRNVGIKVLDGTEEWDISSSSFYLDYNFNCAPIGNNQYCTHYSYETSQTTQNLQDGEFYIWSNGNRIRFRDDRFSTVQQFTAWLASQYANGTPVIIVYPTSSATTETVSGQSLSKPPVTQTAGAISGLTITTTESAHTVPTPQQPLQINCNNGVLKVSKNLFDKNQEVSDGWYDDAGIFRTSTATGHTEDYIYVKPNTIYTINQLGHTASNTGKTGVYFYDINKNWISRISSYNISSFTFTTPNNCYYVRLQVCLEANLGSVAFDKNTCQVEQGSTVTPYTPYSPNGIYTDGTTETVWVHGKNLFDVDWEQGAISGTQNKTYEEVKTTLTTRIRVVNEIYLDHTKTYTISINNPDLEFCIQVFNEQHLLYVIPNITNVWGTESITFTGAYGMAIALRYKTQADILPTEGQNAKVQLELGSTATTYEEYFNGGTATAEMLLKVGDYKDVQSVLDGGVTRNVGIKVLDGTEDWTRGTAIYANIPDSDAYLGYKDCYCTHFLGVNNSQQGAGLANSNKVCVGDQSNQSQYRNSVYIYGTTTDFPDVTTWTNYLKDQYNAGQPVIIVYPLATATTETVTAQPLTIQAGTNVVEITQASMDNLELEVSYKAGVVVTITEVQNAQLDNNVEVTIQ